MERRRGGLKDRYKGGEGSFLRSRKVYNNVRWSQDWCPLRYNGHEKSSIIRARSTHRREMTRERWKEVSEVASSGPMDNDVRPIYHPTDFSEKRNQWVSVEGAVKKRWDSIPVFESPFRADRTLPILTIMEDENLLFSLQILSGSAMTCGYFMILYIFTRFNKFRDFVKNIEKPAIFLRANNSTVKNRNNYSIFYLISSIKGKKQKNYLKTDDQQYIYNGIFDYLKFKFAQFPYEGLILHNCLKLYTADVSRRLFYF